MKNSKTALITGITGQDGSYLAELLMKKGIPYMVLNDGHHHLTPPESIIFVRIPTS